MVTLTQLRASTMLISIDGVNILTDPWFKMRMHSFVPCFQKPARSLEELENIRIILVSHLHEDHFDKTAIKKLYSSDVKIIGPFGMRHKLDFVRKRDIFELAGSQFFQDGNIKITAVNSKHCMPAPCEINFIIEGKSETLFFGGDCRYSEIFKKLSKFYTIDIGILPIGGTKIFGKKIVMDCADADKAARDMNLSFLFPVHEGGIWASIPPVSSHNGRHCHFEEILDKNYRVVSLKRGKSVQVNRDGKILRISI